MWFNLDFVMFLCCGIISILEYNIWKVIVFIVCVDLCFILFGGFCSSLNLNVLCSNVLRIVVYYIKLFVIILCKIVLIGSGLWFIKNILRDLNKGREFYLKL